jgi:hypothetical protein
MPFDLDLSAAGAALDAVNRTFGESAVNDILLMAGRKVGVMAEGLVSDYPPPSHKPLPLWYTRQRVDGTTYKSKFKSMRQQKLVMALIKQGKIPYRRTGTLGKSITSHALLVDSGVVHITIGSNLRYAPYVIDRTLQSHYHTGTWTPIQTDLERGLPKLTDIAINTIVKEADGRITSG